MPYDSRTPRRQALIECGFAVLVAVLCGAMITAAVLVPAPPAVLPLIVLVGIGCPLASAFELRASGAGHRRALARLRRHLDKLPETQHPLGL